MSEEITGQEIEQAFGHANFGGADRRKLLEQGVLKYQAGYRSGSTLTEIMQELGLIGKNFRVPKKGRRFLYSAFKDSVHTG